MSELTQSDTDFVHWMLNELGGEYVFINLKNIQKGHDDPDEDAYEEDEVPRYKFTHNPSEANIHVYVTDNDYEVQIPFQGDQEYLEHVKRRSQAVETIKQLTQTYQADRLIDHANSIAERAEDKFTARPRIPM